MVKEIIRRFVFKMFLFFRNDTKTQMIIVNDSIGYEILYNGYYEKSNLEIIKKSLPPNIANSTFLDIGANIGNHSLFFKDSFDKIESYEPQKKIFEILKLNTQKYSKIRIHNYGISNKDEVKTFNIPFKNSGMASNKKHLLDYYSEKVTLKKLNFRNYTNVGYIKIDVEGSEYEVLKSLDDIIKTCRPLISFELNMNNIDRKKIIDLLKDYGYFDFLVPEVYKYQNNRIFRLIKSIFSNNLVKISEEELLNHSNSFTLVSTFNNNSEYRFIKK